MKNFFDSHTVVKMMTPKEILEKYKEQLTTEQIDMLTNTIENE